MKRVDQEVVAAMREAGVQTVAAYEWLADKTVDETTRLFRRQAWQAYPLLAEHLHGNVEIRAAIDRGMSLGKVIPAILFAGDNTVDLVRAEKALARLAGQKRDIFFGREDERAAGDALASSSKPDVIEDLLRPMTRMEIGHMPKSAEELRDFAALFSKQEVKIVAAYTGEAALGREAREDWLRLSKEARETTGVWSLYRKRWETEWAHKYKEPLVRPHGKKITEYRAYPGTGIAHFVEAVKNKLVVPALYADAIAVGKKGVDATIEAMKAREGNVDALVGNILSDKATPWQIVQANFTYHMQEQADVFLKRSGAAGVPLKPDIEWVPLFAGVLTAPNGVQMECLDRRSKLATHAIEMSHCVWEYTEKCLKDSHIARLHDGAQLSTLHIMENAGEDGGFADGVEDFDQMAADGWTRSLPEQPLHFWESQHKRCKNADVAEGSRADVAAIWLIGQLETGKIVFDREKVGAVRAAAWKKIQAEPVKAYQKDMDAFDLLYEKCWRDLALLPPKMRKADGAAFVAWLAEQKPVKAFWTTEPAAESGEPSAQLIPLRPQPALSDVSAEHLPRKRGGPR